MVGSSSSAAPAREESSISTSSCTARSRTSSSAVISPARPNSCAIAWSRGTTNDVAPDLRAAAETTPGRRHARQPRRVAVVQRQAPGAPVGPRSHTSPPPGLRESAHGGPRPKPPVTSERRPHRAGLRARAQCPCVGCDVSMATAGPPLALLDRDEFIGLVVLLIVVKAFPAMMGHRSQSPRRDGAADAGHARQRALCSGVPIPADRTALAVASSLRHPGLAMMIAKVELPDQKVTAVILAYILIGAIAAIPYTAWRKRAARPQGGRLHVETS